MCGGGSSPPEDNSVELEKIKNKEKHKQDKKDKKAEDKAKAEQDELELTALTGGRAAVEDYFRKHGADPALYQTEINDVLTRSQSAGRGQSDPAASFYDDPEAAWEAGGNINTYNAQQELQRMFPTNFELTKYSDTLDDPYLSAIEETDRKDADQYLKNLLSRGVITQGGYDAGVRDLDRQSALAKAQLNQLGTTALGTARTDAAKIRDAAYGASEELTAASPKFDATQFSTQLDNAYNDFLQNLEVNIRGGISGNLFDTTGLSTVAGAAQGAGNTAYDPRAVSGIIEDDEDTDTTLNRLEGGGIF